LIEGRRRRAAHLLHIRTIVAVVLWATAPLAGATGNSLSLHDAARSEDTVALQTLIAGTSSLNARDPNGWTALMIAADAGNSNAVSMLLAAGQGSSVFQSLQRQLTTTQRRIDDDDEHRAQDVPEKNPRKRIGR
jgi:ankyrin repeat protein